MLKESPSTDPGLGRSGSLCAVLSDLEVRRRRLDADTAAVLAEMERTAECDIEWGMRTGAWWAGEHDLDAGRCARRVRISSKLVTRIPEVISALGEARIGWEHAEVLAEAANDRIIDRFVLVIEELIELASGTVFAQWRQQVCSVVRRLDLDGGHDPDREKADRLRMSATSGGMQAMDGWFTPEVGLPIHEAIERVADELFRRAVRDSEACSELCRRGTARDLADTRPTRPEITLVVDAETGKAATSDGVEVDDHFLRRICSDPMLRSLHTDRHGVPLRYGRTARFAPPALRQALLVRDGGCVFPGCDAPGAWVDVHHVTWWENGGLTDLDNCACLCRHHHRVTHRSNWRMVVLDGQWFRWTTPSGRVIDSQRHRHRERQRLPRPNEARG